MLGEDVKSWFTQTHTHTQMKRSAYRQPLPGGWLRDYKLSGSDLLKRGFSHVKRFTVYTIGTKNCEFRVFLLPFDFSWLWYDSLFRKMCWLLLLYCYLLQELTYTLTVRVENSRCGFQKTLNVRLEIGPLIKEFATPLQKDLNTTENKKNSIEASAIEFLKGSYQSVSPKTLKEGG